MRLAVAVAAGIGAGCTSDAGTKDDTGAAVGETTPNGCPLVYTPPSADLAGCTAARAVDAGADGSVESTETEVYDADGRVIQVTYSDSPLVFTLSWDAAGNLVSAGFDDDGDGTVDSLTTWTYDADGRLTEVLYVADAFGYRTTFTAFSACGPVSGETDDGDDGTVDATITQRYTPTVVTFTSDEGDDGVIDFRSDTTFDAADGRALHQEIETDASTSGPEYTTDWTYDAEGRDEVVVAVSPYAGTTTTTYAYDADGRLVEEQIDNSDDGPSLEALTWDCPAR